MDEVVGSGVAVSGRLARHNAPAVLSTHGDIQWYKELNAQGRYDEVFSFAERVLKGCPESEAN